MKFWLLFCDAFYYYYYFLSNNHRLVLVLFNDFHPNCNERYLHEKEPGCTKDPPCFSSCVRKAVWTALVPELVYKSPRIPENASKPKEESVYKLGLCRGNLWDLNTQRSRERKQPRLCREKFTLCLGEHSLAVESEIYVCVVMVTV